MLEVPARRQAQRLWISRQAEHELAALVVALVSSSLSARAHTRAAFHGSAGRRTDCRRVSELRGRERPGGPAVWQRILAPVRHVEAPRFRAQSGKTPQRVRGATMERRHPSRCGELEVASFPGSLGCGAPRSHPRSSAVFCNRQVGSTPLRGRRPRPAPNTARARTRQPPNDLNGRARRHCGHTQGRAGCAPASHEIVEQLGRRLRPRSFAAQLGKVLLHPVHAL
jgi:hypothetical protein